MINYKCKTMTGKMSQHNFIINKKILYLEKDKWQTNNNYLNWKEMNLLHYKIEKIKLFYVKTIKVVILFRLKLDFKTMCYIILINEHYEKTLWYT